MAMAPAPVGLMVMEPPEPVLIVACAPATVSRLMVRLALSTLPELTVVTLAPLVASTVPPLLKLMVGALNVRPAPDWTVCVVAPKLRASPLP